MQRKVFRVEQMMFARPRSGATKQSAPQEPDMHAQELAVIREVVAKSGREVAALRSAVPAPRLQKELSAAISGMEDATQKILKTAEAIDESARALMATLRNDYERGLAQDLFDQVVQIFEACNFQDLAGQRIGKTIAALHVVEEQSKKLAEIWGGLDARGKAGSVLVNGPKLAGDGGHADQHDIDRIFA